MDSIAVGDGASGTARCADLGLQAVPASGREYRHEPVMADEVLAAFEPMPDGLVLDATIGGAGHAAALLDAHRRCVLLGIDGDPDAVSASRQRLAKFGGRACVYRAAFDEIPALVHRASQSLGTDRLVGALFDLGVSSHQLDTPSRGFSYRHDGPLDMRMNPDARLDAAAVVNDYTRGQLAAVLARHADEPHAGRIAAAICAARPLRSTLQLAQAVTDAVPASARRARSRRHPAMRTFAAVRIEVNGELRCLESALQAVIDRLEPGGRIVTLAYHSGEDRIVKLTLRQAADGVCECPSGLPCLCGAASSVRLLHRKALRPTEAETQRNPRAASARLRAAERLAVTR